MTLIRRFIGCFLLALALLVPAFASAEAKVMVVHEKEPYLFGWQWDQKPESMARIPRAPASVSAAADDQPLRVQQRLPRYRHFRSAAQIHWEMSRESSE